MASDPPDIDFSQLSDEELERLAAGEPLAPAEPDLSQLSDAELEALAAGEPAPAPAPRRALPRPSQILSSAARVGEESRATGLDDESVRTGLEVGLPMAAAPFTGGLPLLARMAVMAGIGAGGATAGALADPPATAAEGLQRVGVNAGMSAIGEPVSAGLGIAGRGIANRLSPFATDQARRALGFLFSNLRRLGDEPLDSANEVARIALDEGIIGPLTSTGTMARRAQALSDSARDGLASARQQIDASGVEVDAGRIIQELDQSLSNWRPGVSDEPALAGHLGDVVNDTIVHGDVATGGLGAQDLADLKKLFAARSKFHSTPAGASSADLAGQSRLARDTTQGFEEALAARALSPEDFERFLGDKRLYGAMQELIDPAFGALASRELKDASLNQVFGMTPQLARLASPTLGGQLLNMLASRGMWMRGNQIAASLADTTAKGLMTPEAAALLALLGQGGTQAAGRPMLQGLGLAPTGE